MDFSKKNGGVQVGNLPGAEPLFLRRNFLESLVSFVHWLNFQMDRWGTPLVCKWHQCSFALKDSISILYRMFEERLGSSKNAGFMPLISRQRFRHIISLSL